ncbi:FlaD/FlaE family flagellar protein [Halopelagius longus]|uniref:Flagella protein n=1 Tax=Halopelagius longus TaxID=1236180 RepID=A0A1H1BFQ9_9EURY|nr:FlaD/FlaE family flagellar protein [Halopelagius longus]RDI70771.1 flagellar protein d/e [Halopelagius longus]SDQ50788.1 flagella protein [Halopelagius longus]
MKIDPENYDLRELRRIADERRADRNGRTSEADEASDEDEADGRRPRREGPPNRSGRNDGRRSREDRDAPRRDESRRNGESRRRSDDRPRRNDDHQRRSGDQRRSDDRPRRNRNGRSDELSRPRQGHSDHGDAQDEVVRADRLASEIGLGRPFGDSSRDGRRGTGRAENDRGRANDGQRRGSRNGHRRDARDDRQYDERGYDDGYSEYDDGYDEYDDPQYDELGYTEYDEGRSNDSFGRDAEYDDYDDHPDDVGQFRFDNEVHERPRGRAGEVLRQNQLEQLLVHETAAAGDSLEKPYLRTLPNEYAAERVVFDWLEFMVLKGGFKRTMDALRYYLTVDWITEDVETELHDYLIGFSGNVADTTEFDVDDHHLSLLYVARLTSMT